MLQSKQITLNNRRPQFLQQQQAQAQQQQVAPPGGLVLPGAAPAFKAPLPVVPQQQPLALPQPVASTSATPAPIEAPATPVPLTLEQQHITAVDGIVPTLQNIVATVNLDCRLDLKTIALHARNAEYNPKFD